MLWNCGVTTVVCKNWSKLNVVIQFVNLMQRSLKLFVCEYLIPLKVRSETINFLTFLNVAGFKKFPFA